MRLSGQVDACQGEWEEALHEISVAMSSFRGPLSVAVVSGVRELEASRECDLDHKLRLAVTRNTPRG
jgi:hypothetical protein